jgi:plastocyanin
MKKILISSLLVASSLFSAEHTIDQKNKTFIPHEITVKVGDTINFVNSDPFAHNAYTDDETNEFDIGMQAPGKAASFKVRGAGKFVIECAIHPNMLLEVTATK